MSQRTTNRSRIYLLEDVKKHASASSCWVVYNNAVFDVSAPLHPSASGHRDPAPC
jgi:cytochrome b involved in lipid metabolism